MSSLTFFLWLINFLSTPLLPPAPNTGPIDKKATHETQMLWRKLQSTTGQRMLFGHQNAYLQGVGWTFLTHPTKAPELTQLTNKYPAIAGFDFGNFLNLDKLPYTKFLPRVKEAHRQGSIVTFSWHMYNPITGKKPGTEPTFRQRVLHRLLPGGDKHAYYNAQLDKIAAFAKQAKDKQDRPIPILFRPFHEQNGDWFWWSFSPASDYKKLWRYTVRYLRDKRNVHQFLYAFSPSNQFEKREGGNYLDAYPGDSYVDILGIDCYQKNIKQCLPAIRTIAYLARSKGKVAALTEVGWRNVEKSKTIQTFWTSRFLHQLKNDALAKRMSYALFWRNESRKHHYLPYPSTNGSPAHPSTNDFLTMVKDSWLGFAGTRIPLSFKGPRKQPPLSLLYWGKQNGVVQFNRTQIKKKRLSLPNTERDVSALVHPLTQRWYLVERSQNGHVILHRQTAYGWKKRNLTKTWKKQHPKLDWAAPRAAQRPSAWIWVAATSLMISTCDPIGRVHVWYQPLGQQKWYHFNLTKRTKAPPMEGTPQAWIRAKDHVIQIVVPGAEGSLFVFWYRLLEGTWRIYNLHRLLGLQHKIDSPVSLCLHPIHASPYLLYRSRSHQLHSLYLKYGKKKNKQWNYQNLSPSKVSSVKAKGVPSCFVSRRSVAHIVFTNKEGRVFLQSHNVLNGQTHLLRFPPSIQADSTMLGWMSRGQAHIVYKRLGQIHELWQGKRSWTHMNLSKELKLPMGIERLILRRPLNPAAL